MNEKDLIQQIKNIIRKYLPEENKWFVFLFGSQANGRVCCNSDVDISIKSN